MPPELADRYVGLGDFPQTVSAGRGAFVFGDHSRAPIGACHRCKDDANAGLAVGLYRSDTDSWSVLPRAPITQRPNVVALWTGTKLIVWGGTVGLEEQRDGAAYNLETNEWRRIADAPFAGANTAAAVWTGHEMIVWGGRPHDGNRGAAYRPSTDSWRTIADAPIAARLYPTAVWIGNQMIVWGSCALDAPSNPGPCDHYSGTEPTDGAAYDPKADLWRTIRASPLPPRPRPRSVWTGKEMLIWGGDVGPGAADEVGAAYNPKTDTWRRLPSAPLPTLQDFSMLWTGEEVLVLGGQADTPTGNRGEAPFGGAYNPNTRRWRKVPSPPYSTAVWSNSGYASTRRGLFAIGEPGAHWPTAILPKKVWSAPTRPARER